MRCYTPPMPDFAKSIKKHQNLPLEDQKKAGQAIAGEMDSKHEDFLKHLIKLLDKKEIDTANPRSFLKDEVYETLNEEWQGKVDIALMNVVDEVRRIEDFYRSKETPNSSPHLQTMIEHLWQMKQRIEEHYDVFKL
jgi:hypothetical protein